MYDIANGYKGDEAIARYHEIKERHGIENLRRALVLASYGYYIALQGTRWHKLKPVDYDVRKHESTLTYLDEHISISEVRKIDEGCPNHEVCYIDFYMLEVHLI
jgi:hypothetical protein